MGLYTFRPGERIAVVTGAARGIGHVLTDEVASMILFPASDAPSPMTGSIALADSGFVCW